MPGRIAVVDAADRFVRWTDRATIHRERLIHRSIHVLVFDPVGRLVIQRRHRSKDTCPRHWDSSCAGHVEESDYLAGPDDDLDAVYRAVAGRELLEELGIEVPLEELAHLAPYPGVHYEQLRLFRATSDGPFTLQPEEVEEVARVTPEELAARARAGEAITPTLHHLGRWLRRRGLW